MQTQSRVPALTEVSFDGALIWFSKMQRENLLFHPEDDPADIIKIADGTPTFTDNEVNELRLLLSRLEARIGHEQVIKAAYPTFMNACGIQPDA